MNDIIKTFESLPNWAKAILLIIPGVGGVISGVYRIIKYLDKKNTNTLIFGILAFVPCIGQILSIIDAITELTDNRIKFMAE